MLLRRPLTRLEMSLAAAILGIAAAVFIDRALDVMELAERATLEVTVSNLNSAVNTRFAYESLKDGIRKADWAERDPFAIAGMTPPSENWSFDEASRELVYRPNLRRRLQTVDSNAPLRFRLVPHRGDMGYLLEPVAGFEWLSATIQVLPAKYLGGRCFS